jgi:hypothetical protein
MKVLLKLRTLLVILFRLQDLLRSGFMAFRFRNENLPQHQMFDPTLDECSMLRLNV